MMLQPLAETDGIEPLLGALPRLALAHSVEQQRQHHVLRRGQRIEQVVRLEDVADVAPDLLERARARAAQLLSEHAHGAFLRGAQRADQREHRRLARPGRPRDDHDLARAHLDGDVVQNLLAQRARAKVVVHVRESNRRGCDRGGHQKISAGSAERTLRSAISAERTHIAIVRPSTRSARSCVISSGRRVASPETR